MSAESRLGVGQHDTGKMRTDSLLSPDAYRDLLTRAGVAQDDIDQSVDRLPTATVTTSAEPTVKLSKTVVACACRARELGINPDSFIEDARVAAIGEGRHKVGMFGTPGTIIRGLRNRIMQREQDAYMEAKRRE